MGLAAPRTVFDQDFRDISSVKQQELGSYAETSDGRGYRYSLAGAVALDRGKVCTNPAVDSNVVDVTVAEAASVGAKEVVIDAGGSVTADAYADGSLTISDATGEGGQYKVKGNTAVSGAGEVTVFLEDELKDTALVADTSKAILGS